MIKKIETKRGLVKAIVIIVIALLIISYLGINIRSTINSPTTQDNFSYVIAQAVHIWNTYLKGPAVFLWNEIVVKLIWNNLSHHIGEEIHATSTSAFPN